jgi:hypothetical protein
MRTSSLLACTLFAAAVVGCAAPHPQTTGPVGPSASVVRSAQVVAVESATAGTSTAMPSSGATAGTTVGSAPTRLTVRFSDGTETAYEVNQPAASFRVGEPLSVITSGSTISIVR